SPGVFSSLNRGAPGAQSAFLSRTSPTFPRTLNNANSPAQSAAQFLTHRTKAVLRRLVRAPQILRLDFKQAPLLRRVDQRRGSARAGHSRTNGAAALELCASTKVVVSRDPMEAPRYERNLKSEARNPKSEGVMNNN